MKINSYLHLFLPKYILINICISLTEKERTYFLSTCKYLNSFKNIFLYHTKVDLWKIKSLWYYNQFTNVIVPNKLIDRIMNGKKIPPFLTHLTFNNLRNDLNFVMPLFGNITHLYLTKNTKISLNNFKLPDTLIHLTWYIEQQLPVAILPLTLSELCVYHYHYIQYLPNNNITVLTVKWKNFKYNNIYQYPLPTIVFIIRNLKKLILINAIHDFNYTGIFGLITDLELINCILNINRLPYSLINLKLDEKTLQHSRFNFIWYIKCLYSYHYFKNLIIPKTIVNKYMFNSLFYFQNKFEITYID